MTDVERTAARINIQDYRERRETDAAWHELAERIATNEVAIENFRELMNRYVGAPDPSDRVREGLPSITGERYGEELRYTEEVCAMISEQGSVIYVRSVDESQRWSEEVQDWYSTEAIFERGKNFFVVEGPILSQRGLKQSTVAQHRSFSAGEGTHHYYYLQSLPPEAFNQPYVPVHGGMTDLPWKVRIERNEDQTVIRYGNDFQPERYRPIDAAFVDMVASSRAQHVPALDTLAS